MGFDKLKHTDGVFIHLTIVLSCMITSFTVAQAGAISAFILLQTIVATSSILFYYHFTKARAYF